MDYEKEILGVLYEAGGDGLSVHKIAIHVHNAHNTLFSPIAFEEVRHNVQKWLLNNSRNGSSPVTHCGKRGIYRLNLNSRKTRQTLLEFGDSDTSGADTNAGSGANAAPTQLLLDI